MHRFPSFVLLLLIVPGVLQAAPRTVHVFVALADNQNQGIVPVPAALGNGRDPQRNLYWGAAYGLKTFFKASKQQEYSRVEDAYISVALAFLNEAGLTAMKVEGLENNRQQPLAFNQGTVLRVEQLGEIIRRILREEFWCRLQGDNAFVHFGWDFYMYIGVPHPCSVVERKASDLGLYVEEFVSPYHEEFDN